MQLLNKLMKNSNDSIGIDFGFSRRKQGESVNNLQQKLKELSQVCLYERL